MIVSSLSLLFLFFSSYRFFSFVLFFFVNFFSLQILLRTVQIVNPTTIKKAEETKEVKKPKEEPRVCLRFDESFFGVNIGSICVSLFTIVEPNLIAIFTPDGYGNKLIFSLVQT